MSLPNRVPSVAAAIPCYNEAPAIAEVIRSWREAMPEAELFVFDNNSRDGTGKIAASLGVTVIPVLDQGKGHAVRAVYRELADFEIVILVDGDGTYPADKARELIAPLVEGRADMTVGARRPVAGAKAMSPVRGIGNWLIRITFLLLIGRAPGDMLSGYRALSRKARSALRLRSTGFEIEAEIACEAVARRFRVAEIPVPYYKRIAGTASKLNAVRDGVRIVTTIVLGSVRLRPWRVLMMVAILLGLIAWRRHDPSTAIAGGALAALALGLRVWRGLAHRR